MKRQIHAVRGHGAIAVAGHDIKLGRGGIREVEFFVQTQQLVFGGRRPTLRGRRTLEMLAALHDEGWITPEARDELSESYRFLRTVEHRLQMVADEQTQRLPEDTAKLARFSRFLGYPDEAAFGEALTAQARRVQGHYALLFEAEPDLAAEVGDLVFTGVEDDPGTLATLSRLGFRAPERATETVRGWHFGRRPAVTSPRAREVLTELVPALIQALSGTADPDGALAALDRAFGRMRRRSSSHHPALARAAAAALRRSAGHRAAARRHGGVQPARPRRGDRPRLRGAGDGGRGAVRAVPPRPRPAPGPRGLPRPQPRHRPAIALRHRRPAPVRHPAARGRRPGLCGHRGRRHRGGASRRGGRLRGGSRPGAGGRIAVLGLGRLGSRQLTADSDLDLVVLYDFDPEHRESDGRRRLDAAVYYNRLTQRLVGALTVPTRRGRLYEVDLRLRPSGGQGPIANQWQRFSAYWREEAALWEHMALTRARAVAGDASLMREAEAAAVEVLRQTRDVRGVVGEVRTMRALIEREKGDHGPLDLKLAPGGLLDLDFLAQALVLSHAAAHPDLVGLDAPEVLERAGRHGLLEAGLAGRLVTAYRLLDDAHHWQRLMVEGDFGRTAPPAARARLAAALGQPDEAALAAQLAETRAGVREAFGTILA